MTTPDGLKCNTIRKIAVFCGASSGNSPEYLQCARELGHEMVRRGIGLVYGGELTWHGPVQRLGLNTLYMNIYQSFIFCLPGGNVGLMGEIAHTVYNGLGEESVIGVIPEALQPREVGAKRTTLSFHKASAIQQMYYLSAVEELCQKFVLCACRSLERPLERLGSSQTCTPER